MCGLFKWIRRFTALLAILTFIRRWWIFAAALFGIASILITRGAPGIDYDKVCAHERRTWTFARLPHLDAHVSEFETTAHWMQYCYREYEYSLIGDYHRELGERDEKVSQWLAYRKSQIESHRRLLFADYSVVHPITLYGERVGYLAHNTRNNAMYAYIRGTQSAHEWALNFATHSCLSVSVECVHAGYKFAVRDMLIYDTKLVHFVEASQRIVFAGHSFGGAMSIALSEYFENSVVYAMGPPCIGNTRYIENLRRTRHIHLISTTEDPISVSEIQERAGYDCTLTCTVRTVQALNTTQLVFIEKHWNSYNWIIRWSNNTQEMKPQGMRAFTVMDHLSYLHKTRQVWNESTSIVDDVTLDDSWYMYEPLSLRLLRRTCMLPFYGAKWIGVRAWAFSVRDFCMNSYLLPAQKRFEPIYFTHGIYASHPKTFEFYRKLRHELQQRSVWLIQ